MMRRVTNPNPERITTPFLAVWMVAYNHAPFIAQAIESVMMQETDFDIRLYIGEDCSTDDTRDICIALQKKYRDKIKLFLNPQNLGINPNAIQVYNACFNSGAQYIAMLEGDDYWTDTKKLQKQVDFLESHPGYAICFHKAGVLKTDSAVVEDFITEIPDGYETRETLAAFGNYIHTPTVVFRNVISALPQEFDNSPVGDFFLYIILSEFGKIKYLDETMAVYRHNVGFFSKQQDVRIAFNIIRQYSCMLSYLTDDKIKKIIYSRQMKSLENYTTHAAYKFTTTDYLAVNVPFGAMIKTFIKKILLIFK